jgi:hypothetical protein
LLNFEDSRKYYYRALKYQKISLAKPTPFFKVSLQDLSLDYLRALLQLESEEREYILKQAVGRIFEDINFNLYHDSISSILKINLIDGYGYDYDYTEKEHDDIEPNQKGEKEKIIYQILLEQKEEQVDNVNESKEKEIDNIIDIKDEDHKQEIQEKTELGNILDFSKKINGNGKAITNEDDYESNLDLTKELKDEGTVKRIFKHIEHKYIKIEFCGKYEGKNVLISTVNSKNWNLFTADSRKMIKQKDIHDEKTIRLITDVFDNNHDLVTGLTNKNNNTVNVDKDKKTKPEIVVYKYSQSGRGSLHEAVIVNGLPFFLKYDHDTQTFELVENIEENSRILISPNEENYPSSPSYSFQSNEELEFFMQKAREVTLDELFKFSKNIFKKYVDQDHHIIILLAADAIWTYFQDLFPATHYGEGIGSNDVGKSSMGYTFEHTGYRVIKGTVISGANYNRVLGSVEPGQCVIVEDEGDNISEDPEKVKILKAGYEYNNRVPKINMNTANQDQNWYFPYCYKIILAEKSLKEYKAPGLVDRTFTINFRPGKVKYSIKEVVSRNLNKSLKLQKLYNDLLSFRKLMLCYRLVHYQDLLPNIETGLKNRDEELCKPLLQLFYGTESLNNDIIPTLEIFVKQRRARKSSNLEAILYPIMKKFVFAEEGLDSSGDTYENLKKKKTSIKIPFWKIWSYIKDGGIDGHYDEKKNRYAYESMDHGTLYLNSLPTIIRDKFTATKKSENYGVALIFDIEKLEKFDDRYSDSYLKEENVKIEVKLKIEDEEDDKSGDYGDYCDFGDFLSARSNNISDKNQQQQYLKTN